MEKSNMRLTRFFSIIVMFSISGPLFAQEWMEFASREDRFTCLFPEQPKVSATTYKSEYGADLPARVYSVTWREPLLRVAGRVHSRATHFHADDCRFSCAG